MGGEADPGGFEGDEEVTRALGYHPGERLLIDDQPPQDRTTANCCFWSVAFIQFGRDRGTTSK